MKKQFTVLSDYYDRLNSADYKAYANYVKNAIDKYGIKKENIILDLACGTGKLTRELAELGFDMIGVDLSPEMLTRAMDEERENPKNILYLMQDMKSFELYGTVDAVVCALDGINYLTERSDVVKCMKLVRNYLNPGGLFIFDVNSEYRFKEVLAKRDYITDDNDVYFGWSSKFHERSGLCDFYLSLFLKGKDGRYSRKEEVQTEKLWKDRVLHGIIKEAGLEKLEVFSDFDMQNAQKEDEKRYYICRCPLKK